SLRLIMLLLATVDLIVLFFMLRSLWRNKWKKRFVKWGQKTFENIAKAFLRFVERFLDKLGFSRCGTIYVEEDNYPRIAFEKSAE
ncbi:MAG: hypothetical protein IJP33_05295, partial [Firmicutes bacterium]|nr:hypothetical protein [Bacillota bacterium]